MIDRAEIFTDTSGNTSVWIHLLWNAQLDAHHNDTPVETTSINLQHPINAAQHIESMRQRGMIATHLLPDPNDPNKRTLTWIQDPAQE